jgi:hypothetical protein
MFRYFALGAALVIVGVSLSADRPSISPADEVSLLVERTNMSVGALALRIHRKCLESVEGWWPPYQSVTLDALCVMGESEGDDQAISSMRIVLFGLAARDDSSRSIWAGTGFSDSSDEDTISDKPIVGYETYGRLLTYSNDIGQPRALGAFSLEARSSDALLSFVACETDWRGGADLMSLSLISARCHSHGVIQGIKLFVAFDLVAPLSRTALEDALTMVVRRLAAVEHRQ